MRLVLDGELPPPRWPAGLSVRALALGDTPALHALLVHAYRHGAGSVPAYAEWLSWLIEDSEFDPAVCPLVFAGDGLVAAAICWTSAFVKDLAVHEAFRGRGVGEALLRHVFWTFRARGATKVELKARAHNAPALRLYARVGMVPVERISEV